MARGRNQHLAQRITVTRRNQIDRPAACAVRQRLKQRTRLADLRRADSHTVVDQALCGRTDAITAQALRDLCASHSADGAPVTDDMFAAALDWALRPVAGTIALIHHAPGGYEPFDYVVTLARDTRAPDDRAWAVAIGTATDAQALTVGVAAFGHSRLDDAVDAFARASTSAKREIAAIAFLQQGRHARGAGALGGGDRRLRRADHA